MLLRTAYLPFFLQLHPFLMQTFFLPNFPTFGKLRKWHLFWRMATWRFLITTGLSHYCFTVLSKDLWESCPQSASVLFNCHLDSAVTWSGIILSETSILQTTDAILEAIDKKQLTATALLDMSKAFDSVDHGIFLSKLQDIGLSPIAIKWFRSYLQSRYQVVKIQNS